MTGIRRERRKSELLGIANRSLLDGARAGVMAPMVGLHDTTPNLFIKLILGAQSPWRVWGVKLANWGAWSQAVLGSMVATRALTCS